MNSIHRYIAPGVLQPFTEDDSIIVRSPGRINLIGEHTDYNNGFVLPAAIDKAVYVTVKKNNGNHCALYSVDFNESIEVRLDALQPLPGHWSTYILGVADQLLKRGHTIDGFDLAVYGDVPLGAGLSSSAALECATVFALNELFNLHIEKKQMTLIAQLAEHTFAGVKCGIMDQFASVFGKKDHVFKLDCRSLAYEYFPLDIKGYSIVLLDSQVKHSLASTEYNVRRQQCEEGVRIIQKKYPDVQSLRDATLSMIEECLQNDSVVYKRCRYIVEENLRLIDGCTDLKSGQLKAFGNKMFATHEGLSKAYEVSCPELDFLVDAVRSSKDVIGARMMGGGFGGCTINLVKADNVDNFIADLSSQYELAQQRTLKAYTVSVEDGTGTLS